MRFAITMLPIVALGIILAAHTVSVGGVGVVGLSSDSLPPLAFVHRAMMDQRGAYIMLWTPLEDRIVVEVQVATRGYVGLGFSPTGGMKGADVVLGWVDDKGFLHFQDRYAFALLTPSIDESQDYTLLGGYENDTHTVLRFSRPWRTCDTVHDFQLSGDTVRVIWSYDEQDPTTQDRIGMHSHRGTRSLYLREPKLAQLRASPDIRHWDILSPSVSLPDDLRTLYWCKLYKIPNLRQKTHVIGYVPLIEETNLQHVHHMLLYECHLPNSNRHLEKFVAAKGAQCYDRNMPFSWSACNTPIVAWAVGSEGEMFPEHVGVPMGEEHGGATYFMLEIHYNNPNLRRGVVDSSGVRIMYTEKLRQHDAGILTLGHTVSPTHIIPPGQKWNTVALCTADCTDETLPRSGINVFQGFLHAHLLGSSISVTQIRKGRELPNVFKDMSYDFNYQQARVLKEEMKIMPGDSLIVKCGYDSTKRKMPTFGGFSTEDEMCLAFLTYYPRANLSGCYSRPDMALVFDTFGIQDLFDNDMNIFNDQSFSEEYINEELENTSLARMKDRVNKPSDIHLGNIYRYIIAKAPQRYFNTSFYEILHDKTTWQDAHMISTLQEMIVYGQHEPSCENHGRILVDGLPKKVKYPNFIALQREEQQCTLAEKDTEVYKIETNIAVPSIPNKKTKIQENQGEPANPTTSPVKPAATVPWRPQKENEVEKDSLTQKGGVPSVDQNSYLLYAIVVFLLIHEA
ncbi:DBH-like monooxygenase protein 1 isoform X2 [Penaeus japonicus]|nr:DBH-like monooxygenase protein 1 isoform X2 [Penaeus japonicus]